MENEFEKIEAFLNNEMSASEKEAFEKELLINTSLLEHFELYKNIQSTMQTSLINKKKEDALRQSIAQIHNNYSATNKKVISLIKTTRWLSAAAAILIIAIPIYFLTKTKQLSSNELYTKYLTVQPLSVVRGNNDSLLSEAVMLYNNKQFSKASVLIQEYLAKDSSDKELLLAGYICYLQTGKLTEALNGFNKIASPENVFTSQAKWYAALTFLKKNDIANCKKILQQIPEDADTYVRAHALLQQLPH